MTRKYKVLFLCRENSARSIIAEALLRELAGHRFDAFSAGPEPATRVHPFAVAQLRPGISDLGVLSPKSWLEFTGEWAPRMDLVIALDECVAGHHTPVFPGEPSLCSWTFANPLVDEMPELERVRLFEKVFWQIVRQMSTFIELPQYAAAAPVGAAGEETQSYANDALRGDTGSMGGSPSGSTSSVMLCRV
ncbi:low molecular weight phosphatase family protein [Paraburkholderia sp. IW21]|uniref:arsenate reductase/protein-tyrosine-phosphatase family protein n=1 Tax=Paraburkholderia sp. IW21 TaxID=3242488 RepID=UPI003520A20E